MARASRMQTSRFHLYLDSADLAELKACLPHPAVYGVTTNPTLLKRAGIVPSALPALFEAILDLGVERVQAQVFSAGADHIMRDAEALLRLVDPRKMVVKIPATREGFRAGAKLIADGVQITFTAVYALEQAMFAAELGAAYAAPYLGRLTDSGIDGLALIGKMQTLIERGKVEHNDGTRLLVASIRSLEDFRALLDRGVGAATLPPKLLGELMDNSATLEAERVFLTDAANLG